MKALELRERGELGVEARVQRGVGHGPKGNLTMNGCGEERGDDETGPMDSAGRSGMRFHFHCTGSTWAGLLRICLSWRTRHCMYFCFEMAA